MLRFAILLCSLILCCQSLAARYNVIYHSYNEHGEIYVADKDRDIRCLFFQHPDYARSQQTCISINQPNKIFHDYQKGLLASLYVNPKPERILVIGLGGGALINTLMTLLPNAKIDVVDLNPAIEKVAKDFFNFRPNNNTNIVIKDGYEFVKSCEQKYNLIILDVFDKDNIPAQFVTSDFVDMTKSILTNDGLIAVNSYKRYSRNKLECKLYKERFANYATFIVGGNRLFFASMGANLANMELIMSNAQNINPALQEYFDKPEMLLRKFVKAAKSGKDN